MDDMDHDKATAVKDDPTGRMVANNRYRAKIGSLLEKSRDERLVAVWQRVCPFPIDPSCELPDRQGIIEDLADFAEVLQLGLGGVNAHGLCRLVEKYATYGSGARAGDLALQPS